MKFISFSAVKQVQVNNYTENNSMAIIITTKKMD